MSIIADRGYEAYNVLAHLIEKENIDFLIRVKQNNSAMREVAKLPKIEIDDTGSIYYAWDNLGDEWAIDGCNTIDLGSTPQAVSQEFYEWFTANATKQ
ncbi:MAG: hypothetical protein IJ493_01420 [Clostridia bacterium]|nr:hypothetical protein [Clostridia bacterium]